MELAAIMGLILGILRIYKYHLLVMIVNCCDKIQEVTIKTKKGETSIIKNKLTNQVSRNLSSESSDLN